MVLVFYYWSFVKSPVNIVAHLHAQTVPNISFSKFETMSSSFKILKKALTSSPV